MSSSVSAPAAISWRHTRGAGRANRRWIRREARVKLWTLGSGSSGNAILVECDGSRILIDCGFGTRTLAKRLKSIDIAPESIEGCLVTHEHSDHISGAAACAKRWGWGLYATAGT